MRAVASILLIGVFVRHDAFNTIAQMGGMTPAAVYYILGGVWESILCFVILLMCAQMHSSIWRTAIRLAMFVGIVEGFQASVCRLAVNDIRAVPPGTNLCDYVTGLPIGSVVMSVYFLIICWSLAHESATA